MFEFFAFGAVASGVLYVQSRYGGKKERINEIDRFFRNAGIGVNERDKDGGTTGIRFPKYIGRRQAEWGITYVYRLPIGMSYNGLMSKVPLDDVLESMFNRDVEVEKATHNHVNIHVYNNRLPDKVLYSIEWLQELKGYKVIVGIDGKGYKVYHDFDLIPHLIIGGMTRYGKSVVMKLLITQLAKMRQGVKFHLFDLKGGLAFNRFKKLPHVASVSRDEVESLMNLKRLRNEIKKRQMYFEEKGYEDIKEAWKAGEFFDRDVIVVDEASVLAPQSKSDQIRNECRTILEFIAQVAGGLGYNLIMCSQYPTGDILPRQVKQNSDARLSFRLPTSTASNVILDETGAEELPFKKSGRAIYKTDGKKIIQVPYMDNAMIDELINPLKVGEIIDHEPTETEREGRSDPSHAEEAGFMLPFPATANS